MRIHGSKGQVKADPANAEPPVTVALVSLNTWTLDLSRDTVDVTAFGDLFKQYVVGLPDCKGTVGGWWDSSDPTLFDIALGDTPCFLELVPSSLEPTFMFKGPAYLSASINCTATGAVSVAGDFVGAGEWLRMPAAP